ncbi:conserved protein of unknown function [Nitrospira japonica]|uniref:Carboxypeptidase regulatory-like domain-containing protein n=1 Tax=Nitrospira japonica TaxID=1325564 RepID=A0A1W1I2Z1_9BACT|nr:hypothetical protein [Nitrospira japonica]SLM47249.1 conserved protein of unknown function [Nitrospira japonica]
MATRGLLVLWGLLLGASLVLAEGTPVAKIVPSGDFLEFEHDGRSEPERLPLYRTGGIRYFSAGIGLEERSASYPGFSLKLIFTAGGKPFLSGVAVTITPARGGKPIVIPREHVEGPWLFVDLSPGLYEVTASYGNDLQRFKKVKVEPGKQRVIHLRWPHDHGISIHTPEE